MSEQLIKIVAAGKVVEIKVSIGKMVLNSFLSGVAWGLGTVIGASFIIAFLAFIFGQINTAPVIGQYISDIIKNIPHGSN